jgi:4-hydroxy-tetrahydrodipicolinate reductase
MIALDHALYVKTAAHFVLLRQIACDGGGNGGLDMKVMVSGLGKAGRELVKTFFEAADIEVMGGICREESSKLGMDIGAIAGIGDIGAKAYSLKQLKDMFVFKKPDAIVDFSSPDTTMELVDMCMEHGISLIIGTTGFSLAQLTKLKEYSLRADIAILYAPNITLGINVLLAMAQMAAKYLEGYDFNITEIHYKGKKDAPSGTAKVISRTLKNSIKETTGEDAEIPINSVRAGGYIGRHEILAVGENDKLQIVHESFSRKAFADGALLAVRNVAGRQGWLEMKDVIRF